MTNADSNTPGEGDTPGERDDAGSGVAGSDSQAQPADRANDKAEKAARDSGTDASAGEARRPRASGGFFGTLIPTLALIASLIAIAMAGYSLSQYREISVVPDGSDAELVAGIEDARSSQQRLADDVEALRSDVTTRGLDIERLEDDIEAVPAQIRALEDDIDAVPAQIRALERRLETLQSGDGGRLDVRDSWLRAEAEYYLELANTELNLGGRWANAIEALELADEVLRSLGDPALSDVRAAIAAELQSLRAVEWPDRERIASDLNGLIDRLPELPMRADSPREYTPSAAASADAVPADDEPGLGRLWQSLEGAMSSVIRVERRDEPVEQALTASDRELVRRQLALELQIARAAVVQQREADFRASLEAAERLLYRDFNRDDAGVVEARRMLTDMAEIDLVPPKPDLSDSLMLLKAAPGTN